MIQTEKCLDKRMYGYWLGKKRPPFSEEWKKKIGLKSKGRCKGEKSHLWKGGISTNLRDYYKKNKYNIISRAKEANVKRRVIVLNQYGGNPPKCACCGEKEYKFLSIDHINGGGNKHRKEMGLKDGKGGSIYCWLIQNNFPKGFQVLCHNCNMAKGFYGKCPHGKIN